LESGEDIDISYLKNEISRTHWLKINKVFDEMIDKEGKILLGPAKEKLGANISYLHIRLARVFRSLK
jgi:hypothetical protein